MVCNMDLNEQLKRMKTLMGVNESWEVKPVKLYHAILKNRMNTFEELMHELFTNGLKPFDNGEMGNAIWFATNNEYADDNRELSFVLEYNKITRDKFDIVINEPNAWAYKPVPFSELTINTVPVMWINGGYLNNKSAIRFFAEQDEDKLSKWLKYESPKMYFYEGIFRQTVQPFCKIDVMDFFKHVDQKYMNNEFDNYTFKI